MPGNALHVPDGTIYFPEPLTQAAIVRRRNRFAVDVDLDGAVIGCHRPATGRIGTLVLDGLPKRSSKARKSGKSTSTLTTPVSGCSTITN